MNWYKNIKIAVPVIDTPNYMNYLDVGHDEPFTNKKKKNVVVWIIDEDFNFYETDKYNGHREWMDSKDAPQVNGIMVTGRYESDKHLTSAVFLTSNIKIRLMSETQRRHLENKVNEILDYKLENPQIMWFGN